MENKWEIDWGLLDAVRGLRRVPLSPLEADVLAYLIEHEGAAVPKQKILEHVRGENSGVTTRIVDQTVYTLRKKLGRKVVRTIFKMGYAIGA